MKEYFKKGSAIFFAAAMLAGCGSSAPASSSTSSTASTTGTEGELAAEQVLNMTYTDLSILDVNDARNANEFQVLTEVQEGLFRTFTDENGIEVIENAGCTGYEVSDDNLTYTFHLREESMWSDGVPVTADNYVDSWKRLLVPDNAFPYAFLATGIEGAEAFYNGEGSEDDIAVSKVDDYTFTCTLAAPDATFIKKVSMLCFNPIRKDLIDKAEANGGNWTNDYTLHVYNGPFVISDRVLENSMTLTKNENYWDKDNVKLETVNLQVVNETATQAQLMESQQLDILTLTDLEYVDQWQKYVDNGTFTHVAAPAPSVTYIAFDMHEAGNGGPSGLMSNSKCRKAISLALDREEYNMLFQNNLSTPAYSLVPYGISVGNTEFRTYQSEELLSDDNTALAADSAALKALFEEGAKEAGYTGNVEDITLTTISYTPNTLTTQILEWYKQSIEDKLGCKVQVEVYPDVSTWKTARDAYEYDFYTMGWFGDYNDPETFLQLFTSDSGYAKFMGGFSNAEYDSLYAQGTAAQDENERIKLFAQAEQLLMDETGVAPLYFATDQIYVQSYVKNLSMPMFGADFEFSRAYITKN